MTKTKFGRSMLAMFFMALMFVSFAVSVYANTTDKDWKVSWSATETDFKFLGASRSKDTSTPVFFKCYYSQNGATYVDVKVLGTNANPVTGWSQLTNKTYYSGSLRNYARCKVGSGSSYNYSISSLVYDSGYSYVTLAIKSQLIPDLCKGSWSADSSNTWKTPTYY